MLERRHLQVLRGEIGDPVVLLPVLILGPAIEVEPGDRQLRRRRVPPDEDRAVIAGPAAVGGKPQELHAIGTVRSDVDRTVIPDRSRAG